MSDDSNPDAIWVKSDISASGTYIVSIEGGPDRSCPLDRDGAIRHAMGVLLAAQYADYDGAILAQYASELGMPIDQAAALVHDLRSDRPLIRPADTAPLTLTPGVSAFTREPFLTLDWGAERLGQWTVQDAKQHALYVLYATSAVDLDAAYYRYLTGQVGLKPGHARAVVEGIAEHRAP